MDLTGTKQRNSGESRISKEPHVLPCLEDQIEKDGTDIWERREMRSENLQARDHLEYLDEGGESN